ncbi:MAG: mechanosensitive ion channel family protein [Calditrichaceae bacterium]|nr:mechanosensitive ion channel family protein [Calditrichaceae bacterium]MBN2710309.1 mechanosensitive ion channel family protein [Calditrichaceae bacterium]RQV93015.1 MAG: mechanosensitive ion channel family protein [Calditrichota bacterium]
MDILLEKISLIFNYKLFELNQTPVSLSSIFMFIIMMIVFYIVSRMVNRIVFRKLLLRLKIEESKRFTMVRLTHYIIMIVGAIVSFQFVGIDLSGLAVIFGLLSVGIGFGLQNVTSNFIAGLILLFERPIKIGDRILVGDTEGDVTTINIRSTTIKTMDNVSIIVPNSEFVSNKVINWSHGDTSVRINIKVGVSYNSDLDMVLNTLLEIAREHPKVMKHPEPDVLLSEFGDSSWNMTLRIWIANPQRYPVTKSEINCAIVRKFREKGIEIPFPQTDLHVRSSVSLPVERIPN